MSMTEQEIRADERAKIAKGLEGWQPFLFHPASTGVEFAVRYLRALKPVAAPEPKIAVRWFDHAWDGHVWKANPVKVATPPKDWRDVPVTAGMLVDAYGGDYPELTRPVERAARVKASQALINEAAQKGWP